jgi:hypothetical protein
MTNEFVLFIDQLSHLCRKEVTKPRGYFCSIQKNLLSAPMIITFVAILPKTYNPSYNWQSQVQDKVETKELSSDSLIIVAALLSAGSHGHDL